MKSDVRLYRPGDEGGIVALHNLVFPENPLGLDAWRWKFEANPTGMKWIAVAFDESGGMIGHFSVVPMRGLIRGGRTIVSQATDAMIHPACRGAILGRNNIFSRVVRTMIENYGALCPLSYGFPAPRHLKLGRILLGYRPLYKVPRHALPLDGWDTGRRRSLRGRFLVREAPSFGGSADRLWQSLEEEHPYGVIRDSSYLNWRYRDCPNRNYSILVLTDPVGRWKGWAVLALHGKRARMVDYLVPRRIPAGSDELIGAVADRARAAGADYLETWIPRNSPARPLLEAFGFRNKAVRRPLSVTIRIQDDAIAPDEIAEHFQFQMGCSDIY
jgi:hypothetical protein